MPVYVNGEFIPRAQGWDWNSDDTFIQWSQQWHLRNLIQKPYVQGACGLLIQSCCTDVSSLLLHISSSSVYFLFGWGTKMVILCLPHHSWCEFINCMGILTIIEDLFWCWLFLLPLNCSVWFLAIVSYWTIKQHSQVAPNCHINNHNQCIGEHFFDYALHAFSFFTTGCTLWYTDE